MSDSKIPPRPWRVAGDSVAIQCREHPDSPEDIETVAECHNPETASLIVRMVNSEAEVVEALGWLRSDVLGMRMGPKTRAALLKRLDRVLAALRGEAGKGGGEWGVNPTEYGWVIERGDSPPSSPIYWCGEGYWSHDNLDAVRFARKVDAERVMSRLSLPNHRVAEHAWVPPSCQHGAIPAVACPVCRPAGGSEEG